MNARLACGLAAGLLLPLVTGCQAPTGVVRGQNPAGMQYAPPTQATAAHHPQENPEGQLGAFHGGHYHTFDYRAPKNLVYPPANMPGAVVQYPYYTLRGPTDFFQE